MKLQHPDATELWIQSLGDKVANDHASVFEDDEFQLGRVPLSDAYEGWKPDAVVTLIKNALISYLLYYVIFAM